MRLKGKVAVVTGGGRGIGLGIVQRLAAEGAAIAVGDIDGDRAATVAETLRSSGIPAFAGGMNVANEESVDQFFGDVMNELGAVSILIHAAGIWSDRSVEQMSFEEWQRIHAVNTHGTFLVCRRAMRDMTKAGYGRIVNIASTIFLSGGPRFSHYAASKGAVIAFSRSLAAEAGAHGITVNCVAPGLIATEAAVETHTRKGVEEVIGRQIIRRAGEPEDIAEAVAYFVGPGAGFTTGQTLYVNGGTHFS